MRWSSGEYERAAGGAAAVVSCRWSCHSGVAAVEKLQWSCSWGAATKRIISGAAGGGSSRENAEWSCRWSSGGASRAVGGIAAE